MPTTRIAIGGPTAPNQHAQIQVAGNLRPLVTLRVTVRDGNTPVADTAFDRITSGGALTAMLSHYPVVIEGLAPGFQDALDLSP